MAQVRRLLPDHDIPDLRAYEGSGGGEGLTVARQLPPRELIEVVAASGLRGRGGAGFPTGVTWRTVADFASPSASTTVVVNAAEGEPGTFKDRLLLRRNPFLVLEGADRCPGGRLAACGRRHEGLVHARARRTPPRDRRDASRGVVR